MPAQVLLIVVVDMMIAVASRRAEKDPSLRYSPFSLVLITESIKFVVSALVFVWHGGRWRHMRRAGALMAIPAALYTLWNVLNYVALAHVSLSRFSVIYQLNIFFLCSLHSAVFGVRITCYHWAAIFVLFTGCFIAHVDSHLHLVVDVQALYVVAQAFIGATAGVITEQVYKHRAVAELPVSQLNMWLYGSGALFALSSIFGCLLFRPADTVATFTTGLNHTTLSIATILAAVGLTVSVILVHFSTIVKVFASAAHSPVEVVSAHFVIGTPLPPQAIVAACLIAAATVMYKMKPLRCPERSDGRDPERDGPAGKRAGGDQEEAPLLVSDSDSDATP